MKRSKLEVSSGLSFSCDDLLSPGASDMHLVCMNSALPLGIADIGINVSETIHASSINECDWIEDHLPEPSKSRLLVKLIMC